MKGSTVQMLSLLFLSPALAAFTVTNENGIRPNLSPKSFAHTSAVDSGISIEIASQAKGLGAFATTHIPVGTLLGTYGGETMTRNQARARYWGKRKMDDTDREWVNSRNARGQGMTGNYLLELPNGTCVCAEDGDKSSWCRFMNHAKESEKECNVKPFMQSTKGGETHKYPQMYAIANIEAGTELCFDYGEHFFVGGAEQEKIR